MKRHTSPLMMMPLLVITLFATPLRAIAAPVEFKGAFGELNETAVLKLTYPTFNASTHAVAGRKIEGEPAVASLTAARRWNAQGGEWLAAITSLAQQASCMACPTLYELVLIQRQAGTFAIVARETIPADGRAAFSLDLAPYKFDTAQTLLGVRVHRQNMGYEEEILSLYRLAGAKLTEVFQLEVSSSVETMDEESGELAPPRGHAAVIHMVPEKTGPASIKVVDSDLGTKKKSVTLWRWNGTKYIRAL